MSIQAVVGSSTQETKHASLFVAGWRPFIGWVCGLAFAWTFLLYPLVRFILVAAGVPVDFEKIPATDLSSMMPALLGMLGLGAMRSYERTSGSERNSMSVTPDPNHNTLTTK